MQCQLTALLNTGFQGTVSGQWAYFSLEAWWPTLNLRHRQSFLIKKLLGTQSSTNLLYYCFSEECLRIAPIVGVKILSQWLMVWLRVFSFWINPYDPWHLHLVLTIRHTNEPGIYLGGGVLMLLVSLCSERRPWSVGFGMRARLGAAFLPLVWRSSVGLCLLPDWCLSQRGLLSVFHIKVPLIVWPASASLTNLDPAEAVLHFW